MIFIQKPVTEVRSREIVFGSLIEVRLHEITLKLLILRQNLSDSFRIRPFGGCRN